VKRILENLNKAFENRIRLGIMSTLMVNSEVDFVRFKDLLGVTDGNLASHLKYLEKHDFISFSKIFKDRKPQTIYSATELGKTAFRKHIQAIEDLLKK